MLQSHPCTLNCSELTYQCYKQTPVIYRPRRKHSSSTVACADHTENSSSAVAWCLPHRKHFCCIVDDNTILHNTVRYAEICLLSRGLETVSLTQFYCCARVWSRCLSMSLSNPLQYYSRFLISNCDIRLNLPILQSRCQFLD